MGPVLAHRQQVLHRPHPSESLLYPPPVVAFDLQEQIPVELVHRLEAPQAQELGLEQPEEVLHHGIVQAIALAQHALRHSEPLQHPPRTSALA